VGKLAVGVRGQRDRDSLPVNGARLSVATLLRRELEGRVRGVFRGYAIVSVGLARDLFTVVRANTPAIVVTEPWDTVGDPVAPIIHRLKVALPSIAIIAYCEPNTAAQREALPLARAGVDAIVLRGIDDEPCVFRASIEQAHHRSLEAEALGKL